MKRLEDLLVYIWLKILGLDQRIINQLNRLWDLFRPELSAIREELAAQRELLLKILAALQPLLAVKILFTVELEGQIIQGESISMTNSQQATATIQPVDKRNQPAPVDGVPVWASSDETIVTVTPAADGMSAVVAAVGPLGAAKVSVTADADLGAGVSSIFGTLDVTITQGQAVGINITLGDATEQGSGVPTPPAP